MKDKIYEYFAIDFPSLKAFDVCLGVSHKKPIIDGSMMTFLFRSSSNFGSFVLFLFFLSITLIQSVLIELSSICIASRPALFNLVLVPTNCRAFNPKFLGNPHLVFACALHSAFIALPVALMFFFKLWQLVRMWAKQNVQRRPSV